MMDSMPSGVTQASAAAIVLVVEAAVEARRRTDQFPTITHVCVGGAMGAASFRGGQARDGAAATCRDCGAAFVYAKPAANPMFRFCLGGAGADGPAFRHF